MASINTMIFLFTILAPTNIILAQSPEETSIIPVEITEALSTSDGSPPSGFHWPMETGWPSLFSGFPSEDGVPRPLFPGSDGRATGSGFTGMPTQHRHKRSERRVIRCDFASQGFMVCHSCREVRRCYPMNYGTITTCNGALRYCYGGRCSSTQGALCLATTPASSSTSSSSTESTSTSTSDPTSTTTSTSSTSSSTLSSSSTSTSTSTCSPASE